VQECSEQLTDSLRQLPVGGEVERLFAEHRSSGSGWCMHDGDHTTFQDACAYVAGLTDVAPSTGSAES